MLGPTILAALLWLGASAWRISRLRRLAARAQERAAAAWAAQRVFGADLLALLAQAPGPPVGGPLAAAHQRLAQGDPAPWAAAVDEFVAGDIPLPAAAGPLLAQMLPGLEEAQAARRAAGVLNGLLQATGRSPFLDPLGLAA